MDYEKLGFKSGLEIHQQLDTSKLFCECPSVLRKDEPDFEIERKLHAVAGESGEVDVAAQYQANLKKKFIYQGYNENTCLVELDEEPPHQINPEALKIAVQLAVFLNCRILPITQIMRKTVIDGSNTSGFQRTVLLAVDGYVETEFGRVGIESIALEEDAARIVERGKDREVYRLDRLGIPLVEITTAPDIKNPEQAKEAALHIGDILRSVKVRRGLGTIRQDVNVSIEGHPRVEIKGVQDMKMFVKTIEKEVARQVEIKEGKSEVRNALPDGSTEFLRPMPGADRMYPETDLPLLRVSKKIVDGARREMPKLRRDVKEEFKKEGLSEDMIKILLKRGLVDEFREIVKITNNPVLTGKVMFMLPKQIASHVGKSLEKIEKILTQDVLSGVLEAFANKKITESQIRDALEEIVGGSEIEDALNFEKVDVSSVEERIVKLIKEKPGLNPNAYMGLIMKEFKGKISGAEVREIIKKYVGD